MCPICSDYILLSKVCNDCEKIRQLTKIYGKEKVIEVLDKVLVVQKFKNTDITE